MYFINEYFQHDQIFIYFFIIYDIAHLLKDKNYLLFFPLAARHHREPYVSHFVAPSHILFHFPYIVET